MLVEVMSRVVKSRLLYSLAMVKDLIAKIKHYRQVVKRNMLMYREFLEKARYVDPSRVSSVKRDLQALEYLDKHLDRISLFLESIATRLETLIIANDIALSAALLKNLVTELKRCSAYKVPFIGVTIDKLDELSREIQSSTKVLVREGGMAVSSEARKIVEEAKKVAGLG